MSVGDIQVAFYAIGVTEHFQKMFASVLIEAWVVRLFEAGNMD